MNVVDSSAWLEYFGDGPNAAQFAPAIEDPESLVVPTLTLFEVFKRTSQIADETTALDAVGVMMQGTVVELSASLSLDAARLSLESGLAMADAIILATARSHEAVLWTQDAHFDGMDDVEFRPKRNLVGRVTRSRCFRTATLTGPWASFEPVFTWEPSGRSGICP